ncbi:MAG: RcpC/CpaB family pilus assembly protein [Actinomycetota bacterium]|nr:RcpC/CpaB family pilus assembly protein [Actinomycetota bacterium]
MGRRTLVLVIAIALATISGYAVWQYLSSVEDEIKGQILEVEVFRASEPIAAGLPGEEARILIETSTALRNQIVFEGSTILCTGAVGANAGGDPSLVGCVQNPSDLNVVLEGRVAAGPIAVGQLITIGSFADTRDLQQRLADAITPGKVAISISVDASTASGGFIRPGDNVNILASASLSPLDFLEIISNDELRDLLIGVGAIPDGEVPEDDAEPGAPENLRAAIPASFDIVQTILQNVQVLAVGADTRPAPLDTGLDPISGIVVFEVTPLEAELIEYARQYTSIALSLLPTGDYVPYDSQPVVVDDIFGLLDLIEAELGLVEIDIEN